MNEKYTLEDLEAYLKDELSAEKKDELEADLVQNPGLSTDLEVLRASQEAINLAAWKKIIREVQSEFLAEDHVETPIRPMENNSRITFTWLGRIAASLLVILMAGGAVLVATVSPKSIQQVDYIVPVMRSESPATSDLKQAYANGAFQSVIDLSNGTTQLDEESQFLTALALIKTGNFSSAIEKLKLLEGSAFSDPAAYYLVQAYLLEGEFSQAKNLMKEISQDPNHAYSGSFGTMDFWKVRILEWKN